MPGISISQGPCAVFRQNSEQFGGVTSVEGADRRGGLQVEGAAHLNVLRRQRMGNSGEAGASQGWRCGQRPDHAGTFRPH